MEVNNYRPISLQPILCKIFEKFIYHKLLDATYSKISNNQHFSTLHRSTNSNLLSTLRLILTNAENGKDTGIFYADINKAFDSINHKLLLLKIKNQFDIPVNILKYIQNSFTNRYFKVTIGSSFSDKHRICTGVPQGGVLSPLLFTLYVNDLPYSIPSSVSVLQFADDVKLITINSDSNKIISNLTDAISNLNDWCTTWKLTLNPAKSKYCYFTKSNHLKFDGTPIIWQNTYIPEVKIVKDLGVLFDRKLTFEPQTVNLTKSLRSTLGMFWRNLSPIRGTNALRSIYFATVQSQIDYGLPIWGSTAPSHLLAIESIHRKFLRFILNIHPEDHSLSYCELTKKSNSFTITNRYKYLTLNLAYSIHTFNPSSNTIVLHPNNAQTNTRSQIRYEIPFFRLDITRRSFLYQVPYLLNLISPDDILLLPKNEFKRTIKNFICLISSN